MRVPITCTCFKCQPSHEFPGRPERMRSLLKEPPLTAAVSKAMSLPFESRQESDCRSIDSPGGTQSNKRMSNLCQYILLASVLFIVVINDYGSLCNQRLALISTKEPTTLQTIDLNAPLCTFQQLVVAFADSVAREKLLQASETWSDQKLDASEADSNTCWSLENLILRVPASVILNRDDLVKLGNGRKGVVHKAVVALPSPGGTVQQCIAAIKTDCCYKPDHGYAKLRKDDNKDDKAMCRSCVSTGSNFLMKGQSFLGGEYTGALPWYAQILSNNDPLPGLLPNWALITDKARPLHHRLIPHNLLGGSPHPDASVLGVLMPIRSFVSLDEGDVVTTADHDTDKMRSFAQTFLPAAEGLQFVSEQLGLSFQDVAEKNVGIFNRHTLNGNAKPTAFLYDNGYVGLEHNKTKFPLQRQFCHERSFAVADREKYRAGTGTSSSIECDFFVFRRIVENQWKRMVKGDHLVSDEGHSVTKLIGSSPSIQQLVALLKELAAG